MSLSMLCAGNRCIRESIFEKISGGIQRSSMRITESSDNELQCTEVILFDEDCYSFEKGSECIFSWNICRFRVFFIEFTKSTP